MASNSSSTIPCLECGHVNEAARVYCHNCGASLDKTFLMSKKVFKEEDGRKAAKRVQKMMKPSKGIVRGLGEAFSKAVIYGVLLGILISALLIPRNLPPTAKESLESSNLLQILENLGVSSNSYFYAFSEDEVNAFLRTSIKPARGPLSDYVKFQRAFAVLKEGVVRLYVQVNILGFPLYASFSTTLSVKEKVLSADLVGLSMGRLEIPGFIAAAINTQKAALFKPVVESFGPILKVLERFNAVDIKERQLRVKPQSSVPLSPDGPKLQTGKLTTGGLSTGKLDSPSLQKATPAPHKSAPGSLNNPTLKLPGLDH